MARLRTRHCFACVLCALLVWIAAARADRALQPILYTVRVTAPATHDADVEGTFPTGRRATIDLMMPVWTPGFYRADDYAGKVAQFTARTPDGRPLTAVKSSANHWQVQTGNALSIVVSYRLRCEQRSVTTNWISEELGVLNGAATFVTLAERTARPHDVWLELPPSWPRAMTALDPAPDGLPHHFRAADYDTLVDSPIVAGALDVHEFLSHGSRHLLVDAGRPAGWDGARAAADLAKIADAVHAMWGSLPFTRYLFLNVFRDGGGGLEHRTSALLTANAARAVTPDGYHRWLGFVGHEYFHAFNAKRLRPIELGPFDYDNPPRTTSLWESEGFTEYYAALMLARGGLSTPDQFLGAIGSWIDQLQKSPGRLAQTLEQSSAGVWNNSTSGVNPNATTVSYYVKGAIVAFLLDARIRHASNGARSLDDVMRVAYRRYGGERGYTPAQFRATASEVARTNLDEWFRKAVASTEELDSSEALDWFGLALRDGTLAAHPDATAAQRDHLAALIAGTLR